MRSVSEIINLVADGVVTTKEQAAAIIEEETVDRVSICAIPRAEARAILLDNIGYSSGYLSHEKADQLNDLFGTEHPVWGRTHPTPDEIVRLSMEYAERRKQERND